MNTLDSKTAVQLSDANIPHNHFLNQSGKWLPAATALLAETGQDKKKEMMYRLELFGVAETVMNVLLQSAKAFTKRRRPDPMMAWDSFPSGHAANAFLGAELLRMRVQRTNPSLAISGYAAATAMASLRLANKKHWLTDVIAGAVLGIAAAKIAGMLTPETSIKKSKTATYMEPLIKEFYVKDNGQFPNSVLPVLLYKRVLNLPAFFPTRHVKKLFTQNGWTNQWEDGIHTISHYHSITHEALAAVKGKTVLLLGGENGKVINFEKGDVIIIPAGVAHKNLGKEKDVICVGGYPDGREFDMNYGNPGERPLTDEYIASVPLPSIDPVYGTGENGLINVWGVVNQSASSVH